MPENTNRFMSNAFGTDFSNVRIHTGSNAENMNQNIQAKAFTHGSDIYFRNGQMRLEHTKAKNFLRTN